MVTVIKKISFLIENHYSLRLMQGMLLATLGFFWLFNASSLPVSNPELIKISGQKGLLDLLPFYSSQESLAAIESYGIAGRELYLRFIVADFVFIPLYSLGFAFLITLTVRSICSKTDSWLHLNVLPIGIGIFDCVENTSILSMLLTYPDVSPMIGMFAGTATLCKNLLTLATLLALGYGGVILLLNRFGLRLCNSHTK